MDSIEPDINKKFKGIPELIFTLGREADDNIGTQGDISRPEPLLFGADEPTCPRSARKLLFSE